MKHTLESLIIPVLPDIPTVLVDKAARDLICKKAALLPPIFRTGFECRLAPNSSRVDLHQCISVHSNEPYLLKYHIDTSGILTHQAWKRVSQFCHSWSKSSEALNKLVNDIWLEIDILDSSEFETVPSVFLTLNNPEQADVTEKKTIQMIDRILTLLRNKPLSENVKKCLRICFDECRDHIAITHIGVMLSRNFEIFRLNIEGMLPSEFMKYLRRIRTNDRFKEAIDNLLPFEDLADRFVLCLDVGHEVYPQIGMECLFSAKHNGDSSWDAFLQYLVNHNLCTGEKRDALLTFPGSINPMVSFGKWPDKLMVESFLRKPNEFSIINKKLNHIKLNQKTGSLLTAKAYFGFVHEWVKVGKVNIDY